MAGVTILEQSKIVPVVLQLSDGATGLFPQAEIYDDDDNSLTTLDLEHKANGLYAPAVQYAMPDEDYISITYIVYTVDYGDTESDIYLRDVDIFSQVDPDDFMASGFSVPNEYDSALADIQSDLDNPDQYKADVSAINTAVEIIENLTGNKVTKSGDVITIYEDNGIDIWRQYDLSEGGRVQL